MVGALAPSGGSGVKAMARDDAAALTAYTSNVEKEADHRVRWAIGNSLLGLYPVYDYLRFVSGQHYGVKVVAPASLRYAIDEARFKAPRGGSDGGVKVEEDVPDEEE